jgi:molybdopterin-containing oxidoreductase family membrane subunit
MVLTLMLITRKVLNLKDYITDNHMEAMAKVVLTTGSLVGLAYSTEFFIAWYSGNEYEQFVFLNRAMGPMAWAYWTMVSCNLLFPQLFWFRSIRRNPLLVFVICIFVNIGMWFERFVIIVTSLHRDFLPSSWSSYTPTMIEWGTFIGSFGLFFTLFLIFCRVLPVLALGEIKGVLGFARKNH